MLPFNEKWHSFLVTPLLSASDYCVINDLSMIRCLVLIKVSNRIVYSVNSSSLGLLASKMHSNHKLKYSIYVCQIICTICIAKLTWGADNRRYFFVTGVLMGTNVLVAFCLWNGWTMFLWNKVPSSQTTHSEDCNLNIQCCENFKPPTDFACLHVTTQGTTLPTN
jgi:hypothetical protein